MNVLYVKPMTLTPLQNITFLTSQGVDYFIISKKEIAKKTLEKNFTEEIIYKTSMFPG